MEKKDIKKLYNSKIKLIEEYNRYYFDENEPLVSDYEYDELKREILKLESNYNFLISKNSPSKSVGHKPSKNFKKFQHRVSMLSLSNAFSEEDLKNFEKKILNFLSENEEFKISYSAEPKIDGI